MLLGTSSRMYSRRENHNIASCPSHLDRPQRPVPVITPRQIGRQ